MTPVEFIDARGGPAAMQRAINEKAPADKQVKSGSISLWRHRNKIPRTAWPEILDAYPDVSLDDLRAVEAAGEAVTSGAGEAAA